MTLSNRRALGLWAAGWLTCGTLMAGAAEVQVPTTPPTGAPAAPELRTKDGAITLGLDEAVSIALQRNLGLVVQRYSREQARQSIRQSKGIFDLGANATFSYSDSKVDTQSGFQSDQTKSTTLNLGLSQLFASGATLQFGWQNGRTESARPVGLPPGTQFQSLFYQTSPTFSLTQPLLRNRGKLATERNILVARLNGDASRQSFILQVTTTIQQVENAYWNLFDAREQLRVSFEARDLAKELHQMNKVRVDVGTLAPLELVQSEVGIATAEEDIIRKQSAVGDAADSLRRLLNIDQGDAWSREVVPETSPEIDRPTVNVDEAIKTALSTRPEVEGQKLTVQAREIDAKYFTNQRRPRLDATVSYGVQGGAAAPSDLFSGITKFPTWSIGLAFAMPIQNTAAKAQNLIASLDLDKAKATLSDTELQVITEVRTAARGVDTAAKQIDSARISRTLSEKNLDAERKRYENGMSTSFTVLQHQSDLTSARSREVDAVTGYRKALVEYYRAIGKLVDTAGVQIVDDAPAAQATQATAKPAAEAPAGK